MVDRSAEMALLLACLRWPVSEDSRRAVRSAATALIDWGLFVGLLTRHRVFALAQHGLNSADVRPPPEHAAQISSLAQQASWAELHLAAEVERLLNALQKAEMTPLVLKGIAVSMKAFGQLGLRFNRDIDLLVWPEQVAAASAILEALNYSRIEPAETVGEAGLARWMRGHKDLVYRHRTHGHIVELHWRLFDNPHLLPLKSNGTPALVPYREGVSIPTLPTDIGLLYLCLHGVQHAWSRLKWLADVGAIFARLDADALLAFYQTAQGEGLQRAAGLALLLSTDLLSVPVPADIVEAARSDWRVRSLEKTAYHAIFDGGSQEIEDRVLGSTWKNLSHYLITDNFQYRVSELWFDMADGRADAEAVSGPLSPITRPFRWLAKQRKLAR
jgi:hypothetical protein